MKPLDDKRLAETSTRWTSASRIECWRALPPDVRQAVLEMWRSPLDIWSHTTEDVTPLLKEISRLRKALQHDRERPK
ncbi:hypothetical protein KRR26_32500 [Corallococcus sp. M34]|uniref:hypothetical protein n=1 Tax=Citreicoccus inhibens TaxID=2849499 RepID=UPI001C2160BF|nr:hypothetical protein [Citreicoccus inhibens]MBU8900339.1 hypothetical protein [Citreicoccus inhibens]